MQQIQTSHQKKMAKISGSQAILLFAGSLDVLFGVVLILMGIDSVIIFPHAAVGVAMWSGIGIVMIGLGNVISVLTSSKTKQSPENLNINCGSMLLNLTGMVLATFIVSFFTWGAWDVVSQGANDIAVVGNITNGDAVSIFATVIIMALIVFVVSLVATFMDCCTNGMLFGGPGAGDYGPRQFYMSENPYGSGYGQPPPVHMYKR